MKFGSWKKWQVLGILSGLLIAGPILLWPKTPQPPKTITTIAELESYMNGLTDFGTPPGMSFAVIKNGHIIYSKGFGWADEPREIRATSKTAYHWWSCTKIATAIVILQLQEKGKLSLNDPVVRHLPFFEVKYPSETSNKVTILNLLNHSSGLPDPSAFTFMKWIHHDGEPSVNQTDFIKKVLPDYFKLKFEPGDHAEYSNIGYMVLGAIIEKITGITYEDYIRQNILCPLGMNQTDFLYLEAMEPDEAAGAHPIFNWMTPLLPFVGGSYIRELKGGHIWMERVYTDQTPSTGLIGPVSDAARLIAAYMNGGILDGKRILSQESIRTMTHDGGGPGFSTKIQLYPDENLGFVLFTNDATCECWKIINLAATLNW
jgi:CubicO group peptidase (beta-lactamase class C family)